MKCEMYELLNTISFLDVLSVELCRLHCRLPVQKEDSRNWLNVCFRLSVFNHSVDNAVLVE